MWHSHRQTHDELVFAEIVPKLSCNHFPVTPLRNSHLNATELTPSSLLPTSDDTASHQKPFQTSCFPYQVLLPQQNFVGKLWHDVSMYRLWRNLSNNTHTSMTFWEMTPSHVCDDEVYGLSVYIADCSIYNTGCIGTFYCHGQINVAIDCPSSWMTCCIPLNDTSRLQTSQVPTVPLPLEEWGHFLKQSNIQFQMSPSHLRGGGCVKEVFFYFVTSSTTGCCRSLVCVLYHQVQDVCMVHLYIFILILKLIIA